LIPDEIEIRVVDTTGQLADFLTKPLAIAGAIQVEIIGLVGLVWRECDPVVFIPRTKDKLAFRRFNAGL
jgi:hypothetical protein